MTTFERLHRRVWPFVGTRRSAGALAVLALAAFAVESRAWPVQRGRDAWDYLVYYLSFLDGSTPFPLVMLVRSPVTALALGAPMQLGGAAALEVAAALMYAVTIVAWAATAAAFSRLGGLLAAIVLLVYTPFAVPFHEPSSDMVVAMGFALFCLGLVGAWRRPSSWRFAALGLGVVALTLARPSYQALLVAVAATLVVPAPWRARLRWSAVFLGSAIIPLLLWGVHNGIRYDDYTVSRSGALNVPFYPAFLAGEIDADNGPSSRRLAELVERQVLPLPPYADLGVDADTYLHSRANFEIVRLAGLVDRVDGLSSNYALLHGAGREIHVDGDLVVRGVNVSRSARYLRDWLVDLPPFEFRTKPRQWPEPAPTIEVGGKPFPNPAAQAPSPDAVPYGFLQCATDEIARCILDDPAAVFVDDPGLQHRYETITSTVRRWDEGLGARQPNARLASALDRLRGALPAAWLWLALCPAALALRRPRETRLIVVILGLTLVLLAVHALAGRPDPLYALPLLPALPVAAICALSWPRSGGREGLA